MKCEEKSESFEKGNTEHVLPTQKSPVINFENASFSWNNTLQDQLCPMLTNLNLKINRGELVCIIGSVGSGKSSLISAMMGEMDKIVGSLKTFGKRSYCPQQAWILNMTIRKNVLFESEYEKSWYDKVVEACQLSQDFKQLGETGGDKTEIGEKGINLSGGQKQRIAMSRAVYRLVFETRS